MMSKSSFAACALATLGLASAIALVACGSSSSSSNNGGATITSTEAGASANGDAGGSSLSDASSTDDSGSGAGGGTTTTGGDGSTGIDSVLSEQIDDMCPSNPTIVTGTGGAGSACQSAYDCAPVCCTCAADAGSGQWLAASCQGTGVCSQSTACDDTRGSGTHHCAGGSIGDASTD